MGTCYYKSGRVSEAILELKAAIDILGWESSPSIIGNYLEALNAADRTSEALEASAVALKVHPKYMQVVYNSGVVHQKAKICHRVFHLSCCFCQGKHFC